MCPVWASRGKLGVKMSEFWPTEYQERKVHPFMLKIWRVVNATLFRITPTHRLRVVWLKLFGAKLKWCHTIYPSVRIYAPWNLEIVNGSVLGPGVEVYNKAPVRIGNGVVVSQGAYICTASHDVSSPVMALVAKPIVIENNVWIASRSIVLPGVKIGEAAVIGCGAVVTKDVEPWTVVGGNPAKVLKKRCLRECAM